MHYKRIKIKQPPKIDIHRLKKNLKCHNVTAQILASRNLSDPKKALSFLYPSLKEISPPFVFKDMDIAVKRIFHAILQNEKILIFGDYDVDGVTATTLLLDFFEGINANAKFYIPDRIEEGYSLQRFHFDNISLMEKVKLIITVDCGIDSPETALIAKEKNIDVIITDHHEVATKNIGKTFALINPKRSDCKSGLTYLAGVGVAFYLIIAMRKFLREKKFWSIDDEPNLKKYCELVALGSIADIVPLINENRIFTKIGFEMMKKTDRLGLRVLLDSCNINNERMNSDDIPFKIAPKINAAGRMAKAEIAVNLLLSKSFVFAEKMTTKLQELNSQRQNIEKRILENIELYLKENPKKIENDIIILANYEWHNGVLGIVASKLTKTYKKPTLLISIKDGLGKGSARSIDGFDLYNALKESSEYLETFGGHSMAAGFSIKSENINDFTKKIEEVANKNKNLGQLTKHIEVDYALDFNEISNKLLDELEEFHPFGRDNPEPIFLSKNLEVVSSFLIGKKHLRLSLRQKNSDKTIDSIFFNFHKTKIKIENNFIDSMIFKLSWNYWRTKNRKVQIIIKDIIQKSQEEIMEG